MVENQKKDKVVSIREKFLRNKGNFKSKIIDWEDERIEIREPSAGQRGDIYGQATKITREGGKTEETISMASLQVWAIIYCCYNPDTGETVFGKSDFEALANMPSSAVDTLARPALKMLGESVDEKAKN